MVRTIWCAASGPRGFKAGLAALAAVLSLGIEEGGAAEARDCTQTDLVYVGLEGNQVSALRLDACAGKLTAIGPVADVAKPRWTIAHPQLPLLYVASDGNASEGSVVAFAVDRGTGALTRQGEVGSGGGGVTHLWLDLPSSTLLAANFGGGSTSSIAIDRDGGLRSLVSTIKSAGSGPHRRQVGPHPHGVAVDPSGRYALVPDLGADRVWVYGFDRTTHSLSADDAVEPRSFVAPPGSGPHRAAFGSTGRFVYLLNELTADVTTLQWDPRTGHLVSVQSLPISSPAFEGPKSGSELVISHDGRHVYVANRGESSLVVYGVDRDSGELSLVQRISSGGATPWSFAIDPSGRWMLVANQRGNNVCLFGIDPSSGRLSSTGQSVDSPAPLSITFMQ